MSSDYKILFNNRTGAVYLKRNNNKIDLQEQDDELIDLIKKYVKKSNIEKELALKENQIGQHLENMKKNITPTIEPKVSENKRTDTPNNTVEPSEKFNEEEVELKFDHYFQEMI